MSVVDVTHKTITIKLVYYGCALGGKTTNLETLHRLTDPDGLQGLVSIATKDDRTLFFDLLPMDLGQVGGLTVKVKLYTVPGQVHYELTRRQVLAGTDGVVLVVDSSREAWKSNGWAAQNLRDNLKANGLDPDKTPLVFQWNKRDLPDALPVEQLAKLNPRNLPAVEAVATTGAGVVETFAAVLKAGISRAYSVAGKAIPEETIVKTVDAALAQARSREPSLPAGGAAAPVRAFEHRVDQDAYRDEWADRGRDRTILDQEKLISEAVQTGMELAERLEGYKGVQQANERQGRMMSALSGLAPLLIDPANAALPPGLLKLLLDGAGRESGSLLLFRAGEKVMDEREVHPAGRPDVLNASVAEGLGSLAFRLGETEEPRWIEDLASEVFFDATPPGAEGLASALVVPLACDGLRFGSLFVYGRIIESPVDPVEREFWITAATFLSLSLHWHALRRKLVQGSRPAAAS